MYILISFSLEHLCCDIESHFCLGQESISATSSNIFELRVLNWTDELGTLFRLDVGNAKSSFRKYGIFLILIVVYCLTICIRFEGKIYISYNLIIYGPNGPLEFAHFL